MRLHLPIWPFQAQRDRVKIEKGMKISLHSHGFDADNIKGEHGDLDDPSLGRTKTRPQLVYVH